MSDYELTWGEPLLTDHTLMAASGRSLRSPRPGKQFRSTSLVNKLSHLPAQTFLAIPEQFKDVDLRDEVSVQATEVPKMSATRQQSRTAVRFGQMTLRGGRQGAHAELVALKPTDPARAAREFHAMRRVQDVFMGTDRPLTFTTLGFMKSDDNPGKVQLVTRYEHSVLSADRILWNADSHPTQEQVADVLGKAALTLGYLHAAGFVHGDPQPKNIAADNVGFRFIDLEDMEELADERGEVDPLRAKQKVAEDLATFLLRLNGDYTNLVAEHFAEPYTTRANYAGSTLPSSAQYDVEQVLALSRREQQPIPYIAPLTA